MISLRTFSMGCVALALAAMAAPAYPQNLNAGGVVMERFHGDSANPGSTFQIQVRVTSEMPGEIQAMGLRETLPDGWSFAGLTGITGDVPAVAPPQGSMGMLEFAWITIPSMPYTFAYTVNIPSDDPGGDKVIHGQLEYRLDGGAQYAAPVVTTVGGGKDTQPPSITLQGGQNITIAQGQGWSEPGYTARDNVDGDLTSQVRVSGYVNPSVVSTYVLTYTVSDRAGNTARAQRTVRVTGTNAGGGTNTPTRPGGGGVGTGGGTGGGFGGFDPGMMGPDYDTPKSGTQTQTPAQTARAGTAAPNTAASTASAGNAQKLINHPTGNMELRPGVAAGAAPLTLPGAPPDQSALRKINHPSQERALAAEAGAARQRDAEGDGNRLSDAWPSLEQARPVEVAKLENTADANSSVVQAIPFGPKSNAANIFVIVGIAALCVGGLAGSFFAARSVYGGGRRRRAAK